jgi:hypothetical protein
MTASDFSMPEWGLAFGWLSILTARSRRLRRLGSATGSPLSWEVVPAVIVVVGWVVVVGDVVVVVVVVEVVLVVSATSGSALAIMKMATPTDRTTTPSAADRKTLECISWEITDRIGGRVSSPVD